MNRPALERLAALLESLPPTTPAFDLESWADVVRDSCNEVCGTTACAVGTAALDPWFQERGLRLALFDADGNELAPPVRTPEDLALRLGDPASGGSFASIVWQLPDEMLSEHQSLFGFRAVEAFFELDSITTRMLFDPEHYDMGSRQDPVRVAARIRLLLAQTPIPATTELTP